MIEKSEQTRDCFVAGVGTTSSKTLDHSSLPPWVQICEHCDGTGLNIQEATSANSRHTEIGTCSTCCGEGIVDDLPF